MVRAKWIVCVAALLATGGSALAQLDPTAPQGSSKQADLQPASSWFWEDPDAAWLRNWYVTRDAVVTAFPALPYDPTSLLVQFKPGTTAVEIAAALKSIGGRTIQTWGLVPGLHHVAIPRDALVSEALVTIKAHGLQTGTIDFAEPDMLGTLGATPVDPLYSLEWGLNNTGQNVGGDIGIPNADIDANLAWDVITGGTFVVGMADSGIRRTHEDLAANIWANPGEAIDGLDNDGNGRVDDTWGWDFWNNDNNPNDDNGHGTHTAGTVGAQGNNGRGITGVCWSVRLAGLKIGSASGSISVSAAISALNYSVGKSIKLSNHSWGGGGFSSSLSSAITSARNAGHILVCAAGNGGANARGDNNDTTPQYPASYTQDNVLSVMAINNDNLRPTFTNYGATSVDLGAPGVRIASCYNASDSYYVYMDGTSMATPHVTGVAALVWMRNPTWTYAQVRSKLLTSTKPVPALSGRCVTGGCVNANNAVR